MGWRLTSKRNVATLKEIETLRGAYGLTLRASDSHRLREKAR